MLITLALMSFLFCVRWLPRWLTPMVCLGFELALRPWLGKERRRLRDNVQQIYGLKSGSHFSRMFERQCLRHQLRCGFETLQAMQNPKLIRVEGEAVLKAHIAAAEARGKPHILVTAHLGAWELAAYYAGHAGSKPLSVLAKPSRYRAVTQSLDRLRRNKLGTPVLWTGTKTLLRDMLSVLKRGEPIGFVMDQKPEGRQGPIVPFMGIPTAFVAGPATMALRFDAAVIGIYVVREGAYRYRIVSELIWGGKECSSPDEQALTAVMAQSIERVIRMYPEQWTWNYKRWRWQDQPDAPGFVNPGHSVRL